MTQEHREQFLAAEGWQQTERGHIRTERFFAVPDSIYAPPMTYYYVATYKEIPSRKFRRWPFGRHPKHDALVGWFDLGDKLLNRGGLRELNEMAEKDAKNNEESAKRPDRPMWVEFMGMSFTTTLPPSHCTVIDWGDYPYGNKRQGWKTINVDGEKTVVEVVG